MIEGIFVEGLIYSIMVLGVFITFRVLDFPDLTVDGSFPLGAAVMAILIANGASLFLAVVLAFLAGVAAGLITAIIHNKLHVPNLLAGILTMTMLWSICPISDFEGNCFAKLFLIRLPLLFFPFLCFAITIQGGPGVFSFMSTTVLLIILQFLAPPRVIPCQWSTITILLAITQFS